MEQKFRYYVVFAVEGMMVSALTVELDHELNTADALRQLSEEIRKNMVLERPVQAPSGLALPGVPQGGMIMEKKQPAFVVITFIWPLVEEGLV